MLVEVMRADTSFREGEREQVRAALIETYALTADEAARLADLAESTANQANDLFGFTSRINDHFDMPDKLRMVEQMWRVAYADGRLRRPRAACVVARCRSAARAAGRVRACAHASATGRGRGLTEAKAHRRKAMGVEPTRRGR